MRLRMELDGKLQTTEMRARVRVWFYLSSSSCYLVNDVCEDDVLIVSIRTHFLPLWILSESDIVAKKRVTNTVKKMVLEC